MLGQELAQHIRQYPTLRNKTLRLLEPLGTLEETDATDTVHPDEVPPFAHQHDGVSQNDGVSLTLDGVQVLAGGHTILEDIDLHIPAGQHVAIVGRSSAGKSSLAGLVLGWHRAVAGSVRIDGAPLDRAGLEALRRTTAWVDPAIQLWNASLLDNLTYAADSDSEALDSSLSAVLEQADLRSVLNKLPEGLQTPLGEGGARLSGGEGQRVRYGRALLQADARLVILDEPFRGLDHEQRQALLANARRHWKKATLLCITHDVADTQDFERVLVVEAGRIVEDDRPVDLLQRPSRYRTLIEHEQRVHDRLWADAAWRRLHLADGRFTEQRARPRDENKLRSPERPHTHGPASPNLASLPTW